MNKIYQTFWDVKLGRWVVTSELGKNYSGNNRTLLSVALVGFLGLGNIAFACDVSSQSALSSALSSGCANINLTGNITLTGNLTASITNDVTINGNGFILDTVGRTFTLSGGNATTSYDVTFNGFDKIISSNQAQNAAIEITNSNANINLKFDNITSLSESTLALLSQNYAAGNNYQNPYSQLIIGTVNDPVAFSADTYKQFVNGAKIRFTGDLVLNGTGANNAYSYIFWSQRTDNSNQIYFDTGSNVTVHLDSRVKFSTGDGNGTGYAYHFADGSKFALWSSQNVFGTDANTNRGVVIGSYDKATNTWGAGAQIQIAGVGGGQLLGDGLTNNGGNTLGINNGVTGTEDVIFNLAAGSNFNVTGKAISIVKNNDKSIYVRTASDITAKDGVVLRHNGSGDIVFTNEGTIDSTDGIGVSVTHNGTGETSLTNSGIINSNNTGIELLSSSGNTIKVNQTGGVINATAGSAIRVGSGAVNTSSVNAEITGGTLNLSEGGNGIDFSPVGAGTTQKVNDLTINLSETANGQALILSNTNPTAVTLNNTHINLYNGIGFNSLNGFTFEGTDNVSNSVTVKGSGYGANVSKDLSILENAYLDVTVESDTGTGIRVIDGATTDVINITENIANKIVAKNATAIEVAGTVGRQVNINENADVNGGIKFNNGNVDNTLNLQNHSAIQGEVTFGNGNNIINVLGGDIAVSSITMGSGNDTVNVTNAISEDALLLGAIDAGAGNNSFNLTDSQVVMGEDAVFSNFSNYGLTNTTLTLQSNETITAGTINISENSTLALNNNYQGNLSANLQNSGTLSLSEGASVNLIGNNQNFSGQLLLDQKSVAFAAGNNLGTASLDIDGTLNLTNLNTLNNTVKRGTGTLVIDNVSNTNHVFNFAQGNVEDGFTGTFDLVDTEFDLSGDNASALTNSTLKVSKDTVVTVGNGQQAIGGLEFNGGQVNFHNISGSTGEFVSKGTIDTKVLDLTGTGNISVNVGTALDDFNPNANPTNKSSVFEMDDENLIIKLATGQQVNGSGGNLTLVDVDGTKISDGISIDLNNSNNVKNAEGTFDFRLAGIEDGLYINYGLKTLNLLGSADNAFELNLSNAANNGTQKNDLSAQITGAGDLRINAENGAIISLSNINNDYSGDTLVDQGTLSLAVDNALGNTDQLALAKDTTVLMNDKKQVINTIDSASGSNIEFNKGQLTIKTGGTIAGNLTGEANVNVLEDNLSITSSNESLTGLVSIGQTTGKSAVVTVSHNDALGSSSIALNETGALNFDNAEGDVSNAFSGNGQLQLTGSNLNLLGDNQNFSGQLSLDKTSVASAAGNNLGTASLDIDGTLNLTNLNALNNTVKSGTGTLVINNTSNADHVFNFAQGNVKDGFTGTFDLVDTEFDLSGDNTSALTNSTLKVSKDTVVTVGDGQQAIGGLEFNGGQLNFHNISGSTGELVSQGTIHADILDLSGAANVSINVDMIADKSSNLSVFEMDEGDLIVQLATGQTVIGDAKGLSLVDSEGMSILKSHVIDFTNSTGTTNAKGIFDFDLVGNQQNGLHVNYGLTELNLLGKDTDAFELNLDGSVNNGTQKNDLSARISGTGDLRINAENGAIMSLSNINNDYEGNTFVDKGTLSLVVDNALGKTDQLVLAKDTTVLVNDTQQVSNTIASESGSTIEFNKGQLTIKTGGMIAGNLTGEASVNVLEGNLNITSSNENLLGSVSIGQAAGNSTAVTVNHNDALGNSSVALNDSGTLNFDNATGDVNNALSGNGQLQLIQSNLNLLGDNQKFAGQLVLDQNSVAFAAGNNLGTASLDIDGTLNLTNLNTLNNTVKSGTGTLVIDNGSNTNHAFNFAQGNVGNDFKGTIDLVNTEFNLSGDNTAALTNSTLKVSAGTDVTVSDGQQAIGGLEFNGGQVNFHNISGSTGEFVSQGTIHVDNLNLNGTGKVSIDVNSIADFNPNAANKSTSIFDMDDDNHIIQLATGYSVTGWAGNLSLVDQSNAPITEAQNIDFINETGIKNAEGTFDFRLTGSEETGLHVNYGLTELNLLGEGNDAFELHLINAQNNGSEKNDLSARITGTGDLRLNAENDSIISLSNTSNSYSGDTLVDQGTLSLAVDNALGNTDQLVLAKDTTVLMNDTQQVINTIDSASGSNIEFNEGQLTIKTGGMIAGNLTGQANLKASDGLLAITSSNQSLSGIVEVGQASGNSTVINANHNDSLGNVLVVLNDSGTLNFDGATGNVSNALSGNGQLQLTQSNLVLTKDSANFKGNIAIDNASQLSATSLSQIGHSTLENNGRLDLNISSNNYDEVLSHTISGSGSLIKRGAGVLVIDQNSLLTYEGNTDIQSGTLSLDGASILSKANLTIAKNAMLEGYGNIFSQVENNGTLYIHNKNDIQQAREIGATVLNVDNNFINNGHIILQDQVQERGNVLNITGNYFGGDNALITLSTKLGIDNETSQLPDFIIGGNAIGHTSLLIKNVTGQGGQTNEEGILLVDVKGDTNDDAFTLANTVMDGAYEYTLHKGIDDNSWYLHSLDTYRPDYGNNLANTLSIIDQQGNQTIGNIVGGSGGLRSSDRLRSGNQDKLSSLWNVTTYGKKRGHTASKQINYDYDTTNTLFGADTSFFMGDGLLQMGGMVGLLKTKSNSHNLITDSFGKGEVKGNQYSIYGTWYFDADTALSPFVDFVVSYGRYKNKINTLGNDQSSYRSHLYSYTLQGGYPIQLGENVIVEPQAQLTYVDYKIKDYVDHTGATIKQSVKGKTRSRIGAYIYPNDMDFRPYAAVNLWYDDLSATAGYNDTYLSSDKRKFMLETKAGIEANLSNDFSLSAEANYVRGRNQYKDYSVRIGLKYSF